MMKSWIVLLGWALLASPTVGQQSVVQSIAESDPMAGFWQLEFMDGSLYTIQRPWAWGDDGLSNGLVSNAFTHKPKVTITPSSPTTADSIEVEVKCWVPASNYGVDAAEVDIDGYHIDLNLHWTSVGYGFQAFAWRTYTTTLGTLAAGTYVLDVNNSGGVTESVKKIFTVRDPLPIISHDSLIGLPSRHYNWITTPISGGLSSLP